LINFYNSSLIFKTTIEVIQSQVKEMRENEERPKIYVVGKVFGLHRPPHNPLLINEGKKAI
jgi:hypothetical protein